MYMIIYKYIHIYPWKLISYTKNVREFGGFASRFRCLRDPDRCTAGSTRSEPQRKGRSTCDFGSVNHRKTIGKP